MRIRNKFKSHILTLLLLTMCMQVFGSKLYTDPKHRYKIHLYCEALEPATSTDYVQSSCEIGGGWVDGWNTVYVKTYFGKNQKQMDRILQSAIKARMKEIKGAGQVLSKKTELFRGMPITIITYKQRLPNHKKGGIIGIFARKHNNRDFSLYELTSTRFSTGWGTPIRSARKRYDAMMASLVFGKYKKFKTRAKFTVASALNKFKGKHIDRLYKGWGVPQDERMTTKSKFLIYNFIRIQTQNSMTEPLVRLHFKLQLQLTRSKIGTCVFVVRGHRAIV